MFSNRMILRVGRLEAFRKADLAAVYAGNKLLIAALQEFAAVPQVVRHMEEC